MSSYIGVFSGQIGKAKPSFGAAYGKEGKYWVILNGAKMELHSVSKVEQFIIEGAVINVVDPGPPAGQRYQTSKGGNETPHSVLDPYTVYFKQGQLGSDARAMRFMLVAADFAEKDLPPSVNPSTGDDLALPVGTPIWPATGQPVPAGTQGAVLTKGPIEYAIDVAVSPTANVLRDIVVEMHGRGMPTQGRGPAGVQKIIAVDPIRRVWAREIHGQWANLHPKAQELLNAEGRLNNMIAREDKHRADKAAEAARKAAAAPAGAPAGALR